jgi:hypothetical protein
MKSGQSASLQMHEQRRVTVASEAHLFVEAALRHIAGGKPNSRRNARVNAASDS